MVGVFVHGGKLSKDAGAALFYEYVVLLIYFLFWMTSLKIQTYRSKEKEKCSWSILWSFFALAMSKDLFPLTFPDFPKTKMHLEGPRSGQDSAVRGLASKCNDCQVESVSFGTLSRAQFFQKVKINPSGISMGDLDWKRNRSEIISSETFMIPLGMMVWHAGWPKTLVLKKIDSSNMHIISYLHKCTDMYLPRQIESITLECTHLRCFPAICVQKYFGLLVFGSHDEWWHNLLWARYESPGHGRVPAVKWKRGITVKLAI